MAASKTDPPVHRRLKWLLAILLVVGIAGILFRKSIQDAVLLRSFLMSSSPAEATFRELADRASDPFVLVQKVWASEKIPHRALVAGYLKDQAVTSPELLKRAEPLLMSAVTD